MSVSRTVFETFSVKECRDLEIWGRSRSLKIIALESLRTVSYSHSIVTNNMVAASCIISEIKWDIGRKSRFFILRAFDAPVRRFLSEYYQTIWLFEGEKVWRYVGVSIEYRHVTDRQTDGQASLDSTIRTMHGIAWFLASAHLWRRRPIKYYSFVTATARP